MKTKQIIEAQKDWNQFREFLQYAATFLICFGLLLILYGGILGVINLVKGL